MYSKPVIYKIYSIILLVLSGIGFISSLIQSVVSYDYIELFLPSLGGVIGVLKFACIMLSLVSLFFAYIEFSSMFTFAEMIQYEQSNSMYPFKKKGFVFVPKFYKNFGMVIFMIVFLVQLVAMIVLSISASIETKSFITLPLVSIVICIAQIVIVYITYYSKHKAFGDLLEITSTNDPTEQMKANLKENKPNTLRAYCVFLFILAIATMIAIIVMIFMIFGTISSAFGVAVAVIISIGCLIMGVVNFLILSVIGCYFDNLAKMVEHYMIKYRLLED